MPAELSLSFFVCPDILITITIFIPQLSERHSRRHLAAEFIADHLHLLCWTYLWLDPQLVFSGQDNEQAVENALQFLDLPVLPYSYE